MSKHLLPGSLGCFLCLGTSSARCDAVIGAAAPCVSFRHRGSHRFSWCLGAHHTKSSRRTFFRACVFTIFLPHLWNGFIFFCGIYKVFLVPCIVLVSEMLSFTMGTKLNDILICKLHRFVLYEVVLKASRGSLLQQGFFLFLVFFQSNVFRKRLFIECQ